MREFNKSKKFDLVRSDIRGPVYLESLRLQSEGKKILRLNTGNPPTFGFSTPQSIIDKMSEDLPDAQGYCDAKGYLPAREAIAEYAKSKGIRGVSVDDIFIGNGVSELIMMCMLVLLNPGDEILIPAPDYPLWTGSSRMAGGTVVHYLCDEQSDWMPDINDIKRKITPNTKAIVLINPNNPTGALYPREVLEEIVKIAKENELMIFSDEIYDRLVHDKKEHISTASLADDDLFVVTFNGISKSHIVCGYRCGWMVCSGNKEKAKGFMDGIRLFCSMRLCANAPAQHVIPLALQESEFTDKMVLPGGRIYEQVKCVHEELKKIDGISFVPAKASFYVFPKLDIKKFNITNDEQFAIDFLRAKNVMIINGKGFNWAEPDHFRIVCLPEVDELRKAIRDLGDFLSTYKQ